MISVSRQKQPILAILGIAILAAAVLSILFSGASQVTQANIEAKLQQFAEYVEQEAQRSGKESRLSYGNIAIEGWGYEKMAIVQNVSLEISEKALLDTRKWSVSTSSMVIQPDPTSNGRWLFVFSEPIHIIENSQLKTTISYPQPALYSLQNVTENKMSAQIHRISLPTEIILTPANNAGEITDTMGLIRITFSKSPDIVTKFIPDTQSYETRYNAQDLKMTKDGAAVFSIGGIGSDHSKVVGPDSKISGKYTLTLSDLMLYRQTAPSRPYGLNVELTYRGEQPKVNFDGMLPKMSDIDVEFNTLSLRSDNFLVKAGGIISTSPDDPLPSGSLDINIDHAQEMLASELIPEAARHATTLALKKIIGGEIPEEEVTFNLKRESNGVFYIGNVTFEELAALLISSMLRSAPPQLPSVPVMPEAPVAPPENTDSMEPATIEEMSKPAPAEEMDSHGN